MRRPHHGTKSRGVNRRRGEPIDDVIRRIELLSETILGPAVDDAMALVAEIKRLRTLVEMGVDDG